MGESGGVWGSLGVIGWGRVRGRVGQCEDEKPSDDLISDRFFLEGDDGGRVRYDMA